jgi:hypothetical protein
LFFGGRLTHSRERRLCVLMTVELGFFLVISFFNVVLNLFIGLFDCARVRARRSITKRSKKKKKKNVIMQWMHPARLLAPQSQEARRGAPIQRRRW